MAKVDPITMAVLINNLKWTAEEMNEYLAKSGFSTNIKVRRDCSCALYTRNGDMLAQGEFIPVHLGIMSQNLKEILKEYPAEKLKEGDAIINNDPYRLGSHLWDVMVYKPIFYKGKLIAWAGNLAHHVDIGGSPLRQVSPTIFEEGLRIPPIKIMEGGKVKDEILKIITTNVRTAYEVRGDLMAQTAANHRGEQRVIGLVNKYGVDAILDYFEAILDYSEKGMRKAIEEIPEGEASFEDYMEFDGIDFKLTKVKVKVTVKKSDIYLDFTGSGEPGKGGVNSPWSLTHSATYYSIKSVLGPQVPTNSGAYRPIHISRPDYDTLVDAKFPHAVGGCTDSVCVRTIDVIVGALSKIVPEKVCACDGHYQGLEFIGIDPRTGRFSAYTEAYGTGKGAKHDDDGADAHQPNISNTANAPIEIIELEHPIKVDKYGIVDDSGGAGKFRGGCGMIREVTLLTEGTINRMPRRVNIKPYGLFGGEGGATDSGGVILSDGRLVSASRDAKAGNKVFIRTSGGGGWGSPLERDIKAVEWDVLNGYVSSESARERYGCVINSQTKIVDPEETEKLRSKLKRQGQEKPKES